MILNPTAKPPKYLKSASDVALNSEHGIYKMGAILVNNGNIVAIGWNKNKSHPKAKNYTRTIHAELDALIGSRYGEIFDTDMYVARITKGGALATSKPCKDCMVLIKEAGISSVTFIDDQGHVRIEKL